MIKKLAIPFSLAAVATLAACATGPGSMHDTVVTGSMQPGYVQGYSPPAGYVIGGYVQPSYQSARYEQATYIQPANGQPGYAVYGPVPVPGAARVGTGKIALLTDLSGPVADVSTQRVTLRMRDGSWQTIDVRGQQLTMGEEIRVREDGTIRREPRA
jgi:hypothetical protein